jgi:hypothetical protein
MCFPEVGIAVGLRPGDVLFFNPQYYHCVSGRTREYNTEQVYVTSFYMKSKQLGLNDNSIGIDNFEIGFEDDGLTNIAVVFNELVPEQEMTDYCDIPTEIEALICTPEADMWTDDEQAKEQFEVHFRMTERNVKAHNFSINDMKQKVKEQNKVGRFLSPYQRSWSFQDWKDAFQREQDSLNDDDRKTYDLKNAQYDRYTRFLQYNYPIFYEGISDDESVNANADDKAKSNADDEVNSNADDNSNSDSSEEPTPRRRKSRRRSVPIPNMGERKKAAKQKKEAEQK